MSEHWNSKDPKIKALIEEIRKLPQYDVWRGRVLRRDVVGYPKIPKGIQVHHRIEISTIIKKNNLKTVRQAIGCEELWDISNGVVLKRGEHFILTRLRHYKYLTKGFHEFILEWLSGAIITPAGTQKRAKKGHIHG